MSFPLIDSISAEMHNEIFTTLLVFLSSANREIVKSTLGFVKLAIHTFPVDVMRPHLAEIVPALLRWSHDHKNHFKAKVRHIFERMIRRFGWEDVYSCAGEEEASKMLVNIKKRKDRAKKKRAQAADDDDDVVRRPFLHELICMNLAKFTHRHHQASQPQETLSKTSCMAARVNWTIATMRKSVRQSLESGEATILRLAYASTTTSRWIYFREPLRVSLVRVPIPWCLISITNTLYRCSK